MESRQLEELSNPSDGGSDLGLLPRESNLVTESNGSQIAPKAEPWSFEVVWDVTCGGTLLCRNHNKNSVIFGSPSKIKRSQIEECPLSDSLINTTIETARQSGFFILAGTWKVPGNPTAIVLDVADKKKRKNVLNEKLKLIETVIECKIPETDRHAMEAIVFNYCVVEFVQLFTEVLRQKQIERSIDSNLNCSVYYHDWSCGIGLLLMHHTTHLRMSTVFMIDASVVEYDLKLVDAERTARERELYHRWAIERNAAGLAEYFGPPL